MAALTTPVEARAGNAGRALFVATSKYQETEAEGDLFAYPASLPELAGNSGSSFRVTNSGCERTAGKITRSRQCCKSNFSEIRTISRSRPAGERRGVRSKHGDWIDVNGNLDAFRRRHSAGYYASQEFEGLRVRATELEMETMEIADLLHRRRCRAQDPYRGVGRGARMRSPARPCMIERSLHCFLARSLRTSLPYGGTPNDFTNGQLDFAEIAPSRDGRPGGLRGARVRKFVRFTRPGRSPLPVRPAT